MVSRATSLRNQEDRLVDDAEFTTHLRKVWVEESRRNFLEKVCGTGKHQTRISRWRKSYMVEQALRRMISKGTGS